MESAGNDSKILFEEIQQFTKASVRDFIKILMGIVFVALVVSLVLQKGRMTDYNRLLIIFLPILLVANFILGSKLIMQIRTDGIYVRFPPWQSKFAQYDWSNITEAIVKDYKPMQEFMGWGIRYAPGKIGFIVSGNKCIEIVFKNGNRVLITTQRPDEVNEVLRKIERF